MSSSADSPKVHGQPGHFTPPPGAAPPPSGRPNALAWIPIRSLGPGHRPRILDHLLALSEAYAGSSSAATSNDPGQRSSSASPPSSPSPAALAPT